MPFPITGSTTPDPAIKTKPQVDVDTLAAVDPAVLEDSHVYVHCYFNNTHPNMLIRIWKSTFLIDKVTGTRSRLLHTENISIAPQWTMIPDNRMFRFLLVFEGLPKSCSQFDLLEDIPQAGGFHIKNIGRNETDVYHVDIH
jgi:hypothetical protein